jgi:hypothetical protein
MTRQRLVSAAAMVTAATVLIGALAAIGIDLPRPAWSSDLDRLAGDIKRVEQLATEQALESAELRALRIEQEIEERREQGANPGLLEQEVGILKRRVRALQKKLDELQ